MEDNELNSKTKIWRYLSFDKFADLLDSSEIYLSSPDEFSDLWEQYPPKAYLNSKNWEKLFEQNKYIEESEKTALIDKTIAYYEYAYYFEKHYKISCWTRAEEDHAGFWHAYTDRKTAVAISTNAERLFDSIVVENIKQSLTFTQIKYSDYEDLDAPIPLHEETVVHPIFIKRNNYSWEQEVRLVLYSAPYMTARTQSNRLKLDLNTFIDEIVVAPNANAGVFNTIQKIADLKGIGKKVRKSKMSFDNFASEKAKKYDQSLKNYLSCHAELRENPGFFIVFEDTEKYNIWSAKVNEYTGIPYIGVNSATGFLAYTSCVTNSFFKAIPHANPDDKRVYTNATSALAFGEKLVDKSYLLKEGFQKERPY